jgi:hypothetical protein
MGMSDYYSAEVDENDAYTSNSSDESSDESEADS